MWPLSKLDAIVISALSLGGTGAMVEAHNRVVIDPPEAVAEVAPAPNAKSCTVMSLNSDIMLIRNGGLPAKTEPVTPPSCANE